MSATNPSSFFTDTQSLANGVLGSAGKWKDRFRNSEIIAALKRITYSSLQSENTKNGDIAYLRQYKTIFINALNVSPKIPNKELQISVKIGLI